MSEYQLSLARVEKELSLETLYTPADLNTLFVESRDVNRPGLELNGYVEHFESSRIIVIGNQEASFLATLDDDSKRKALENILPAHPPAVIFARSIQPSPIFLEMAKLHKVPLFSTEDTTSSVISALVSFLNVELAPRVTRHGVLVEVYGEGIFIVGDSGVGKSETAIELVKRGHRLIADDAVEIRRVSAKTLVGSSPANIRHFSEIRGIGIINVASLFGMGAVKPTERIDFIVNLEAWDENKSYDRMGLNRDCTEILGLKIPVLTIPVRQGRNLAVIIEVAAMNNRQKASGNDAALELMKNLGLDTDSLGVQEHMIDLDI
ncbi:MAG: HPr(Ser) kinase/phosphatase [Oscillospiraceae bacterium]|nr:HPr(Ser) kinase/phosphatase [Oscillospiraceae bacterium]